MTHGYTITATPESSPKPLGDHSADWRMVMLALAATVAGAGGALGAWILLRLIALATNLFWFGSFSTAASQIADSHVGLWVLAIPAIGSVIVGLMARFGSEKIRGHGIPEAIEAILYGESRLSLKVAILKPLSSAISIGSGGPFGAEGPIIMTGGAIGSLFAQCFRLSAAERKTLLVAGAAAGMTGIFGTPLAAILLAVEVLLFEWKPRSFVPVTIAVLVSFALRQLLLDHGPLFPMAASLPFSGGVAGVALVLGGVIGLEAALLSTCLYRIEDLFHRLPIHWMWWPALGGVAVGIGGWIDMRVLGAGYGNIQLLLDGAFTLKMIALLLVVKAAVWLVALGSGTSGGVLAPLLILGGATGALLGHVLPGPMGFWAMAGMGAMMSGAMRAPLTGALFAAELTGQFNATPTLMAASIGAYGISVLVMRRSILTEKFARRGRHILQEYTVDPLDFMQAGQVMTHNPQTLSGAMQIREAAAFFAQSARHRSYPVVDGEQHLLGLVSRSDALRWRVEGTPGEQTLAEVVSDASQPFARRRDPIGAVADLMVETGIGRIPILEDDSARVIGILSRHDLLKARSTTRGAEKH